MDSYNRITRVKNALFKTFPAVAHACVKDVNKPLLLFSTHFGDMSEFINILLHLRRIQISVLKDLNLVPCLVFFLTYREGHTLTA